MSLKYIGSFEVNQSYLRMKSGYIALLLIFFSYGEGFSQNPVLQVIASAGTVFEGNGMSVSWTLGEVATETGVNKKNAITQGFQQTQLTVNPADATQMPLINFTINAYPNPASDHVFLEVDADNPGNFQYVLINSTGNVLSSNILTSNIQEIDLQSASSGVYFLEVLENKKLIKTFKILKL